jgi:hypothetical protein
LLRPPGYCVPRQARPFPRTDCAHRQRSLLPAQTAGA